ncbi:hypothetical protein C6P98_12575 [Burkholderia multivorans]|uniref:Uncharacterized protein n=1 Tax=Burkholderia multivorans TaxID=87883 RepID=A0A8E2RW10_9BURK|nr:hypothetical protein C6P98_12575 [Burkholderia multivorans]
MRPCEAGSAREAHGAASCGVSILRAGDRFDCPPNRDSQSESSQLMNFGGTVDCTRASPKPLRNRAVKVWPRRFYVTRADRRADRSCEERVRCRRRRPRGGRSLRMQRTSIEG